MARELLIDIGNSRIKWLPVVDGTPAWESLGSCAHAELVSPPSSEGVSVPPFFRRRARGDASEANSFDGGMRAKRDPLTSLPPDTRFERAWIASVAPETVAAPLIGAFFEIADHLEHVSTDHPGGSVAAAYQGMGVDRWLALQAAWSESRQACVIADCGSALTLDLLDGRGVHRGGWIAAGLPGTRAGLAELAPGLPGFEPDSAAGADRPAEATATQIARGLILQQAATVERAWRACCRALNAALPLLLTGGDAVEVQSVLEVPSRRDDALVLKGLLVISGYG